MNLPFNVADCLIFVLIGLLLGSVTSLELNQLKPGQTIALMSVVVSLATFYLARHNYLLIKENNALSLRPAFSFSGLYNDPDFCLTMMNVGNGPAKIIKIDMKLLQRTYDFTVPSMTSFPNSTAHFMEDLGSALELADGAVHELLYLTVFPDGDWIGVNQSFRLFDLRVQDDAYKALSDDKQIRLCRILKGLEVKVRYLDMTGVEYSDAKSPDYGHDENEIIQGHESRRLRPT